MKVLVVDDSISMADMLAKFLEHKGIRDVDICHDARCALEKIRNGNYDAYIIDYHLPNISGTELAEEASKKGGIIAIITADKDFHTQKFKVFYKPFKVNELCDYILSSQLELI